MTGQTLNDERTVKYSVARRFIIKLGIIAHGYGPSAARLENYLNQVTEALGYGGHFHSTRSQADEEMPEQLLACAYVSCLSSAACPLVPEQVLREAEYEGNSMAC